MSTELKQVNKLKKTSRRNGNLNDIKFVERLIKISRVTKVTKGGKKLSFRAVVVIGDENGQVGVGVGKAEATATSAILQYGKFFDPTSIANLGVESFAILRE